MCGVPISGLKFSKIRLKRGFGPDKTAELIEEKEEDVYISFAEVISARNDQRGSVIDLTIKKPKKNKEIHNARPTSDSSCSIIRNQFYSSSVEGFT